MAGQLRAGSRAGLAAYAGPVVAGLLGIIAIIAVMVVPHCFADEAGAGNCFGAADSTVALSQPAPAEAAQPEPEPVVQPQPEPPAAAEAVAVMQDRAQAAAVGEMLIEGSFERLQEMQQRPLFADTAPSDEGTEALAGLELRGPLRPPAPATTTAATAEAAAVEAPMVVAAAGAAAVPVAPPASEGTREVREAAPEVRETEPEPTPEPAVAAAEAEAPLEPLPPAVASLVDTGAVRVGDSLLNVRAGPDTSEARLFVLAPAQEVEATHRQNGWVRIVTAEGRSGWVDHDYLENLDLVALPAGPAGPVTEAAESSAPAAEPAAAAAPDTATATRVVGSNHVSVRAGPSNGDARVFVLSPGQEVSVDRSDKGWLHVTAADGRSGWAYSDFFVPDA